MNKRFWIYLIVPLAITFAIAVLAHLIWPADGFFINLATEIVGILVTVCFVDWVLREHERQKWLQTDARIAERLQILLNAIVSSIRGGLGYGTDVLDERVLYSGDMVRVHRELIRVGVKVIAPDAQQRIRVLDVEGWKRLAVQVGQVHNAVLSFFSAFQNRLSPEQISHLLDIQDGLSKSLTFYTTFPDIMGVPVDELPSAKTPPEDLQRFGCQSAAAELVKVLHTAELLSSTVNPPNHA